MANTPQPDSRYDVIVVGLRVAGAATAMLLARRGLRVLAVDRSRLGSDTLSTLALMRGGVIQLERWGVLDAIKAAGTPVVRSTSFYYGDDEAVQVPIKRTGDVDGLYAPRRTLLDGLLVEAARGAGVDVQHEVKLVDLLRDRDGRIGGAVLQTASGQTRSVHADLVIGADGRRSKVARLVAARAERCGLYAAGVVYGYWSGLDVEGYHWYYRPGTTAGAIPTNDSNTLIFVSVPDWRFDIEARPDLESGFRAIVEECSPTLADSLRGGRRIGSLYGHAGQVGYLRECLGPGWALVGDAGYFKDPITAHGITDALRDAELLARAVSEGRPAEYRSLRDELSVGLFKVTDRLASFEWDLATAKELHLRLSDEMKREARLLSELDRPVHCSC